MPTYFLDANPPAILVRHKKTLEVYRANLLDDREDGTYIFQIIGDNAHTALVLCDSDNLEVDTLFEESWEVVKFLDKNNG